MARSQGDEPATSAARPVRSPGAEGWRTALGAALVTWVFAPFLVRAGSAAAALDGMRVLGLGGFSVTMPHKEAVAAAADLRTPTVEKLGASNTVVNRDGVVEAGSTDGVGFVDALRVDAEFDPAGRRCVVLGAGGAWWWAGGTAARRRPG